MKFVGPSPKQRAAENIKTYLNKQMQDVRSKISHNRYKMKEFIEIQSTLKRELAVLSCLLYSIDHPVILMKEEENAKVEKRKIRRTD